MTEADEDEKGCVIELSVPFAWLFRVELKRAKSSVLRFGDQRMAENAREVIC